MITTIKCSKCGFEDSGKFCSNCGSPLEISEKEMTFTDDPVGSWFDKCPVCKSGKLSIERKKMLFGLIKNENIKCSNCDSIFIQEGEKYRLSMVMDSSNSIWRIYGNKALDENEWKSVAFEPPVDEKQREVDIEKWLTQIKDGDVSPMSSESPVLLKKSEELILSLPEVSLLEARAVITGRSRGSSIRIAKGLSFRLGAFKAQSHDELKNIDQGDFTLTNKRVVFSGSKRTLNIPLNKIISAEPYSDAIALRREDKEKTQYFTGIDRHIITISLSGRTYKEPFSGQVIQCLMEGLTQQSSKTQLIPNDSEFTSTKSINLIDKCLALHAEGKYEEAIGACEEAIKIDPQSYLAWQGKGLMLGMRGLNDEALKAFEEVIKLNPSYAEAWYCKSNALNGIGMIKEADAALAKAKELGYTD